MNMEKTIIGRTIRYLISRDIWLAILICGHIFVYYNLFPQIRVIVLSVLIAGAFIWILFFIMHMKFVLTAKKDKYLASAFKDEYFINTKTRAGYNGYITMIICCMIFILVSILFSELSISVDIPIFIAGEIILLVGVAADDISKITLSRG